MLRPEQKCGAKYTSETIQQPIQRYYTDFEGKNRDLGPNTKEQPGIQQVEVSCSINGCPLKPLSSQVVGKGPYGAFNDANRQMKQHILDNCPKAASFRKSGTKTYDIPQEFFPQG